MSKSITLMDGKGGETTVPLKEKPLKKDVPLFLRTSDKRRIPLMVGGRQKIAKRQIYGTDQESGERKGLTREHIAPTTSGQVVALMADPRFGASKVCQWIEGKASIESTNREKPKRLTEPEALSALTVAGSKEPALQEQIILALQTDPANGLFKMAKEFADALYAQVEADFVAEEEGTDVDDTLSLDEAIAKYGDVFGDA